MSTATPSSVSHQSESISASDQATRMERLIATVIDGACMLAAFIPLSIVFFMLGLWKFYLVGMVFSVLASAGVFLLLNYKLLKNEGQTIGKRVMNIRIVGRDNERMAVEELLMKRYAPIWLVSFVPFLGPLACLANALLIFRESQACGHDEIAQTKVVPVQDFA